MKQLSILFRGTLGFPFPVSGAFALCLLLLASCGGDDSSDEGYAAIESASFTFDETTPANNAVRVIANTGWQVFWTPESAAVRVEPASGSGNGVSRPEKGLQKRVNLMQQKTNSDLSRHYLPRQLRHLILQEYLSGVKTARQLSEEHGIPMSTIHKMGQRWKAKNSCSFVSTPNPYPIMSRVTSEEASELLSENKALRRRLEEALLRLEGYEIMGDILQEEYGIDLLKKSAAGQSSVSKKDTQQ